MTTQDLLTSFVLDEELDNVMVVVAGSVVQGTQTLLVMLVDVHGPGALAAQQVAHVLHIAISGTLAMTTHTHTHTHTHQNLLL